MTAKTEKALDSIYAGEPAAFIKNRNALASELRERGDASEAERVKALRKPSKAAGVLNALALGDPKSVKRYLGLAEKLRKATSGKVDAKRIRELAREEGELLEELVAAAREMTGAGQTIGDRVRETLQAAQVDPDLAQRVLAGRVEREERAASVGLENLAAPPKAARRAAKRPGKAEAALGAKESEARRKRIAEAKEALKQAKAEAREAAREVARAQGELAKAERGQDAADRKVKTAQRKLDGLR